MISSILNKSLRKILNFISEYLFKIKTLTFLNNSNYKYILFRRIILLLIDSIIFLISLISSLNIDVLFAENILGSLFLTISYSIFIIIYFSSGAYSGITRFSGNHTLYAFSLRNLLIVFFVYILALIFQFNNFLFFNFINLFFYLTILSLYRFLIRDVIRSSSNRKKINLAVFISNFEEAYIESSLRYSNDYQINYFIDNSNYLKGRNINGVKIINLIKLKEKKLKKDIDKILINAHKLNKKEFRDRVKYFQDIGYEILYLPKISKISKQNQEIFTPKPLSIEQLLGRDAINPKHELIESAIQNKTICITGAGGSIGSDLTKKILNYKPKILLLIDNCELNLYKLELDLKKQNIDNIKITFYLGSVLNKKFLKDIFNKFSIDIIYHAAAFKHVPLVELNPIAGIENNVLTTYNICQTAIEADVKRIILISTDKAVRPTNVMGATKRLAELIIQSFADQEDKKNNIVDRKIFAMVRFGNVLGSSGSVVPLFKKQIEAGGPITITHKNVIRYFMTISEAAQLVLQASSMAKGGELFLLDMGEQIKIFDLAMQMIKLNNLNIKDDENLDGDIEIKFTGLRPGEKLYEELLIDGTSEKTSHPLIYKAKEKFIPLEILSKDIEDLKFLVSDGNVGLSLKLLSKLVPEWRQTN